MTDIEILNQVINTLDNIEIPSKYIEKIGIPIMNSSNLLKALTQAVQETARKKMEEEAAKAEANPIAEDVIPEEGQPMYAEEVPVEETEEI